jgi:hypothetical protein
MRPIPVAFHIWFVEIHTYGIGLALTFWFGLRYTERRLRKTGYPWQWVTGMFLWVIVAAIVGARALHVLSNLSFYSSHPGQVFAIWQGGLSSFGGLLFAVPVAIVSQRRRCPELPTLRFADLMAPVLMACWGIGRLLGPQLMVAGGGHRTTQWFGMYYANQPGKRLPVPIFQALEDFAIFGALLLVERWLRSVAPTGEVVDEVPEIAGQGTAVPHAALMTTAATAVVDGRDSGEPAVDPDTAEAADLVDPGDSHRPADDAPRVGPFNPPPAGIVLGVGMVLWGIERYLDEHLWLGEDGHLGSLLVQWAGALLAVAGIVLLVTRIRPLLRWQRGETQDGRSEGPPQADHEALDDPGASGADDGNVEGPDIPAAFATPLAGAGRRRPARPGSVGDRSG